MSQPIVVEMMKSKMKKNNESPKPTFRFSTNDAVAISFLTAMAACSYFVFIISSCLLAYFKAANRMTAHTLFHSSGFWIDTACIFFFGALPLYGFLWMRYLLKHLDSALVRRYLPWLQE